MDHADVRAWVDRYERVWRTAGTDGLADLFTADATYLPSPWATPIAGTAPLAEFWDAERDSPDEVFTMSSQVLAVDGDTAVVRVAVDYGDPVVSRWLDLWVLRFDGTGRCRAFEEWPFAPNRADGA
jgi:ketosteroid isomerase-like protein